MFPKTLTTERLLLRPRRLEDAEAMFARYGGDPVATRYLSWPTHRSVEDARSFLQQSLDCPKNETHWAITVSDAPDLVGTITAWRRQHAVEIGYVLSPSVWGHGYATEAARAVVAAAWRDSTVWRVHAFTHTDNKASQRVLEKCGMRPEGTARRLFCMPQLGDEPQDCALFAQVRDDLA